jgi:hypothetical protein
VAAALREVLSHDPIVVGGTAEDYWTSDEYHETDLDMCGWLTRDEELLLVELGFRTEGRHRFFEPAEVAVEFPEAHIDGDEGRTIEEPVGDGAARIIGVDDLYVDRLRQATIDERGEGIEFNSALAIMAARHDQIDRRYVAERIALEDGRLGPLMKRLDSKIRRRVRRALTEP